MQASDEESKEEQDSDKEEDRDDQDDNKNKIAGGGNFSEESVGIDRMDCIWAFWASQGESVPN